MLSHHPRILATKFLFYKHHINLTPTYPALRVLTYVMAVFCFMLANTHTDIPRFGTNFIHVQIKWTYLSQHALPY